MTIEHPKTFMEVYSWERHRTKWWIFQQALFDYRRVVYGKSISYSWLYHSMPVASLCSHPSSFFSPLKLPFLGCARFRQTTIIRQISRDIPILAGYWIPWILLPTSLKKWFQISIFRNPTTGHIHYSIIHGFIPIINVLSPLHILFIYIYIYI